MTPAPRGQNLVLLALTMLFLALMVTMTIGLGLRLRQKHELQDLADAAAFSNAVMTARAFNNAAAVNRLEVSYWVAMSADQSLISWTGYATALGRATASAALELNAGACVSRERSRGMRADLRGFASDVSGFVSGKLAGPDWHTRDRAAGLEARAIQGRIAGLRGELSDATVTLSRRDVRERLTLNLKQQQLTRAILDVAEQPDIAVLRAEEVTRADSAPGVSLREIDCDFTNPDDGPLTGGKPPNAGLCLRGDWGENMLQAAMGTRGDAFLTARTQLPSRLTDALDGFVSSHPGVSVQYSKQGSAYWAARMAHGNAPEGTEAWGDDHGSVTVRAGGCSVTRSLEAYVKSTHIDDDSDQHAYGPEDSDPEKIHTMGSCQPMCPSVWVRTIGFKPSDERDAWGQPKLVVALQRLPRGRPFPWELRFQFPFSAAGSPREWDGTLKTLHTASGAGEDISRQVAVATGIAYYHRAEHWEEFPNLLNPFWRAALAPIDVDERAEDLDAALSPPGEFRDTFTLQRRAAQALRAAGFRGLH